VRREDSTTGYRTTAYVTVASVAEGTVSEWPTWATERVVVVPWDPAWSALARELKADLDPRLARWLDGRIEHVGSTSFRGSRPSRSST
jgi:hypothetical protein